MTNKWKDMIGYGFYNLTYNLTDSLSETDKVAGFDLDGTIIKTKSGRVFPKDADDWKFTFSNIKEKLQELINNNYKIIIITNQGGLKTEEKITIWKTKINQVIKELGINIAVLVAIDSSFYRKPNTGFYNKCVGAFDPKNSFYCGDMAGRPKDHGNTDYKLALNLGIKFYTPEEYFSGKKEKLNKIIHPCANLKKHIFEFQVPETKSFIINVGNSCSGKSFFTEKYLIHHGFECVNQDKLKSFNHCKKVCEKLLAEQKNIVIDNTNPDLETRKKWIELARKHGYYVVCCWFDTPKEIISHNNGYRHTKSEWDIKFIPEIAFRIYEKKFIEPTKEEGFDQINKIKFSISNKDPDYLTKFFY